MKKNRLNKAYWDTRYANKDTPWNLGYPATPIIRYIDQLKDPSLNILIPGAGLGYEAQYLWHKGFKNCCVLDLAKAPLMAFEKRVPEFPKPQLLHQNFFDLDLCFDLVIEQTFFCALAPNLRDAYVNKMASILKKGSLLVGLFFDFELTDKGPPFGGNAKTYSNYFSTYFKIKTLQPAINSVKPRVSKELFFIFERL